MADLGVHKIQQCVYSLPFWESVLCGSPSEGRMFTHMDLHDSQAEHRREWKREQYRRMLPLSAHKRIMAVTIWWEAGKLVCMALRYLGTEYLATWERCRISDDVLAGVSAHGVVHPNVVPEQWRAFCWKALQP